MTTVSYCSVSQDGVAFGHEIWMRPEIIPQLKKLTDAVHKEGAAASIQLGHCGFFANKSAIGKTPIGPSRKLCLFRYSICREMNEDDMARVKDDFGKAAKMAIEAGFDAVEIHAGRLSFKPVPVLPGRTSARMNTAARWKNRLRFLLP
jgi:2,4-dienoyl-CoA reductase-like NADH-dependent reductase (Old Yellow Enzyme family)